MHQHTADRGHSHGREADGSSSTNAKRLLITLVLVVAYMVAEVIGGLAANSLALLADAGHMLSDAGPVGARWSRPTHRLMGRSSTNCPVRERGRRRMGGLDAVHEQG